MGRWFLLAFLLSLAIHALFWAWAHVVPMNSGSIKILNRTVPRTFHLERVDIDPKLLEPAPDTEKRPAASPASIKLPDEKASFEKMLDKPRDKPVAPKADANLLTEKPAIAPPSFQNTLKAAGTAGANSAVPENQALDKELIAMTPAIAGPSVIEVARANRAGGFTAADRAPGFSNLDDLLGQTGPLSSETAPILMPTDLLFDYDKPDLRDEAVASLKKLGELIRRNPSAKFNIEGHTDSFGADEYNLDLSRRRAESVKAWLTGTMGLPPESIETRGFGKGRLIAPATGTVDEQQVNRRVEIVIHTPAAAPTKP
jgi:outer membrane protein OmpA-like peptidoglycan-associated protein